MKEKAVARREIKTMLKRKSIYAPYDAQIREMAKLGVSLRKAVEELRRLGLVTGTRQALHLYLQTVEPRITWRSRALPSMYEAYDEKIRKMAKNGLKLKDAVEELRRLGLEAATFYGLKTYSYEIARPPIRWSLRGKLRMFGDAREIQLGKLGVAGDAGEIELSGGLCHLFSPVSCKKSSGAAGQDCLAAPVKEIFPEQGPVCGTTFLDSQYLFKNRVAPISGNQF